MGVIRLSLSIVRGRAASITRLLKSLRYQRRAGLSMVINISRLLSAFLVCRETSRIVSASISTSSSLALLTSRSRVSLAWYWVVFQEAPQEKKASTASRPNRVPCWASDWLRFQTNTIAAKTSRSPAINKKRW